MSRKQTDQMILKSDSRGRGFIEILWKSRGPSGDQDANLRRGCEGIPLNVVNRENVFAKVIFSMKTFVGRITFMIDAH